MSSQRWDRLPSGMESRYTNENGIDTIEVRKQSWVGPRWAKAGWAKAEAHFEFKRRVRIALAQGSEVGTSGEE
jgi:hypothetical protein